MSTKRPGGVGGKPAAKTAKPVPGVERGDHVYVQHPKRGAMAVRVLSTGKDGFVGEGDDKRRHPLGWESYVGHKKRMLSRYAVVDQGADGALLEDDHGRRRFLAGEVPVVAEPAAGAGSGASDDPLTGGMGRLAKSEDLRMIDRPVLFMKAGPVANRPGLALKRVTDKGGHSTQRWSKTGVDAPAEQRPAAAPDAPAGNAGTMKHGDVVGFKHGNVEGSGKIVASGADGVTVHDGEREHQVRHDALTGAAGASTDAGAAVGAGGAGTDASGDGAAPAAPPAASPPAVPAPTSGTPPLFGKADFQHLPEKAVQPFNDKDALYKASGEALAHLKGWLDQGKGVCSQMGFQTMTGGMDGVDWDKPGGMLFIAPLKGEKRAGEKVQSDYGGNWNMLKDTVRCSIAVDTMDDIADALEQLKASGMELAQHPKDRFAKPLPEGYRDLMMNVKFPNGLIGEVQIHLKKMLQAKEAGHKPYEVMRTIDAKKREEWTDEDGANWQAAFDQSSKIYGDAWAAAGAAKGGAADGAAPAKPASPATAAAPAVKGPDANAPRPGTMAKALLPQRSGMASMAASEWEHREREGAYFRRPKGRPGGITHVLNGKSWQDYTGDRTAAYLESDPCEDPLGGGGDGGGGEPFGKAMALFFKASIPGGAMGDLFAAPVRVAGHTTAGGTFVAPYTATRMKAPERPAFTLEAPEAPPPAASRIHGPPVLSEKQMRQLERIKNYGTRYEAVIEQPDGSQVLLCYTSRKNVTGLLDALRSRGEHVEPHLNLPDDATVDFPKGKRGLYYSNGVKVHFSGRTQRDAIIEGSLPYVGDAKPAAPAPPPRPAPPAAPAPDLPAPVIEAPAPAPVADWRDETDWHARTQAKLKGQSDAELRYIAQDAAVASRAMEGINSAKAGQYADEAGYARAELARRVAERAAPSIFTPLPAERPRGSEPGRPVHIQEMQGAIARIEASHFKTASQENAAEVYRERLSANPAKWKPGLGVRWGVTAGGKMAQWNRGFRVVAVHPEDLQATIQQVADTGLTSTGGNNDRIEAQRVYLGDLRRDKQYDRP